MTKRVFSREFKLVVIRQLVTGEKRLAQLCREHTLCESLVRRWHEQYERRGENAWLPADAKEAQHQDDQTRIALLEAALGRATLENELLRHALKSLGKGGSPAPKNGR